MSVEGSPISVSADRFDRAAVVWGTLSTLVGGTFLLQEMGVWAVRPDVFLPVLLIVAGAVLVLTVAGRQEQAR